MAVALDVLLDKPAAHGLAWESAVVEVVAGPLCKVVGEVESRGRGSGVLVVDEADQLGVFLLSIGLRVHDDVGAEQVAMREDKLHS